MKKKWQFIIGFFTLLLFTMWLSNPSSGSFISYIKKRRHIDPTQKANYIPGRELVALKIGDEINKGELEYDLVRRIVFKYKSYLIFSRAMFVEDSDPSVLETRHFYIGVFDNFIPIGSEIPTYTIPNSNSETYVPHPSDSSVANSQSWKYSDNVDKQTGGNIHVASIESPTRGFALLIRKMAGQSQVFLTLNEQFVPEISSVGVNVSFDNGKIKNWHCDTVGKTNNSVIIILGSLKFISNIKKANHLRIDAEIYNGGVQQMEFDVEGLKWE